MFRRFIRLGGRGLDGGLFGSQLVGILEGTILSLVSLNCLASRVQTEALY